MMAPKPSCNEVSREENIMIIVTGANGQLGRAIVERLLELVPAEQIGVSVRDPEKAQELEVQGVRTTTFSVSGEPTVEVARQGMALAWTASSDGSGSGVASYRVFRNGVQVGTTSATTYTDAPGNGTWSYTVKAVDVAGNVSAASNTASIKVGRK